MNHDIRITYCVPCGYQRRAQAAADMLKDELGVTSTLIPGKGGVFKVAVGEKTLTQRSRGYFPSPAEIVAAVRTEILQTERDA